MKPLYLTLLLFSAFAAATRAQDTIYLNIGFRQTTANRAMYYGFKTRTPTGWQATYYYLTGKLKMIGQFADDSLVLRKGDFAWYDTSGTLTNRNAYANNVQEGPAAFYYADGKMQMSGYMRAGRNDGYWIGYYPSGKVSGKATYRDGKQISARMYHEDGTVNKDITEFIRLAEFPGGVARMNQFVNRHLRYPESAAGNRIQGTAAVAFSISEEGKPYDFKLVSSSHPDLGAEALRLARLMPDWEPAIKGGIYVAGFGLMPVLFRLNSK